jgi:hypothetical protein
MPNHFVIPAALCVPKGKAGIQSDAKITIAAGFRLPPE